MLLSQTVIDQFHDLYFRKYSGKGLRQVEDPVPGPPLGMSTYWRGVPAVKCPLDLWVYQEIICEIRPDLIIETGTAHGGSALFMSDMLDLNNDEGEIVSIDIDDFGEKRPVRDNLTYLKGSSIAPEIIEELSEQYVLDPAQQTNMVVLDSLHTQEHVFKELEIYSRFVSVGSYLIVEDSCINGHPVYLEHGPGPMEAIQEFLRTPAGKNFEPDKSREKFMLTFNPGGYLKRVK